MNAPMQFTLIFVKKEQVAKDTYTFYFDRIGNSLWFDFIAGQYVKMTFGEENHLFTISSSPNNKNFLTITTKMRHSSFKKALLNLTTGIPVSFEGLRGDFVLKETDAEYVFLVGGIGVTPLMSILHFLDEQELPTKITLLASFSTVEEVIYYKEFKEIESRNPNVKIVYTLTHLEESVQTWTGETGRISEEMIKKYIVNVYNPYYYIVGPPKMVDAMIEIVEKMGVRKEKMVKESFSGY